MNNKSKPPAFSLYANAFMKSVFFPLLNLLDHHLPADKQKEIAQKIAVSIAQSDNDLILLLLLVKTEAHLLDEILQQTIDLIDDERFQVLLSTLADIREALDDESEDSLADPEQVEQAYMMLSNSPKGRISQGVPNSQELNERLKEKRWLNAFQAEFDQYLHQKTTPAEKIAKLKALSEKILQLLRSNNIKMAEAAIEILAGSLFSDINEVRPDLLRFFIQLTEMLLNAEQMEIVTNISHQYIRLLKTEKEISPAVAKIITQLKELVIFMIKKQQYNETSHILETLFILMTRRDKEQSNLSALAGKTIEEIADSGAIEIMLDEFQTDRHEKRKYVCYLLPKFGGAAVEPLLLMLKDSPSRTERARILQAIIDIGPYAASELVNCLAEAEEWYYIRNVILLLGEVGDETHVAHIRSFLNFRDIRVRREAVKSIAQIGGEKKEAILISLLESTDQRIKVEVAEALGRMKSRKATPILIKQLQDIFENGDHELLDGLAEAIVPALGLIGSPESMPTLNHIIRHERMFKPSLVSDRLIDAALDALDKLKELQSDEPPENLMTYQISVESFKRKNSPEHSPDAVINALSPVDQSVLALWPDLFDQLTDIEARTFYHFLKPLVCQEDTHIFKQGKLTAELFFIQEGELVLAYDQGQIIRPFGKKEVDGWNDEEVWIKSLYKGDLAGQDTFFIESVYTTSMRSLTPVKFLSLEKTAFQQMIGSFPAFENKFKAFCHSKDNLSEILNQYGMERRIDFRFHVKGNISLQFLDVDNTPSGDPMTAGITDLSTGGLCCQVRINPKSSVYCTNTKANIKFLLHHCREKIMIEQAGTVVSVYKVNGGKDFRIHLKFDEIPVELLELFPLSESITLEDPNQKVVDQTFLKTVLPFC